MGVPGEICIPCDYSLTLGKEAFLWEHTDCPKVGVKYCGEDKEINHLVSFFKKMYAG